MHAFSAAGSTARRMGKPGALAACRADGTEFAAEASISHFRVGASVCYTAIIRDVTERTRILAELEASEQRARMHSKANAIKYNRQDGAIFVSIEPAGSNAVRIVVRDTGDGLDAAQLANLFQPFNRLGKETGSEIGTGVGLIVTKRLVESMGGVIGVESRRGHGTSFWVRMPVAHRA